MVTIYLNPKMINAIYQRFYPVLSIILLQIGVIIENTQQALNILIFLIQIIIAILTIIKLWKEIKINKSNKTTKQIEKEVTRKNKFLISILQTLKNLKK